MIRSESAIDKLKAQRARAVKKVLYAKKAKGDTKADLHDKATNLLIAHGISEGKSRVYAPDIVGMLQDPEMHKATHSIRRIAIDSKINSIKDPKMSAPIVRKRKRSGSADTPLPPEIPDTEISSSSIPRSRAEATEIKAQKDAEGKSKKQKTTAAFKGSKSTRPTLTDELERQGLIDPQTTVKGGSGPRLRKYAEGDKPIPYKRGLTLAQELARQAKSRAGATLLQQMLNL